MCFEGLAIGFLAEFGGVLCADHVRFHSCRPSSYRRSDDDTKIVKSRVSGFSRGKLEAGRNELGL